MAKKRDTSKDDGAPDEATLSAAGAIDTRDEGDDPEAPDDDRAGLLTRVIPDVVAGRIADEIKRPLSMSARALLAEACYVFGIDADPTRKPRELAAFRHDPGDPDGASPVPEHVVLVTAGGLKLRYPMDDDTETRLRTVYNCFRVNAKTGEREVLPLPPDLTLPREAVDGIVRTSEHQYRTGYLREGGRSEADRRARIEDLRRAGRVR